MQAEAPTIEITDENLARECLYRFLSAAVSGPTGAAWDGLLDAESLGLALEAAATLQTGDEPAPLGLDALVERLLVPRAELRDEYDRVFGLVVPRECPPYETEYYPSAETFARSQQMADIAGFYRAFGLQPSRRQPERPDHLALELEFMAFLLMKRRLALATADATPVDHERAGACDRALRDFFRDHLAWWVPSFATGLARRARGGYTGALAATLAAWIPAEGRRLGITAVLRPARPDPIERPEEQGGCGGCPAAP